MTSNKTLQKAIWINCITYGLIQNESKLSVIVLQLTCNDGEFQYYHQITVQDWSSKGLPQTFCRLVNVILLETVWNGGICRGWLLGLILTKLIIPYLYIIVINLIYLMCLLKKEKLAHVISSSVFHTCSQTILRDRQKQEYVYVITILSKCSLYTAAFHYNRNY